MGELRPLATVGEGPKEEGVVAYVRVFKGEGSLARLDVATEAGMIDSSWFSAHGNFKRGSPTLTLSL